MGQETGRRITPANPPALMTRRNEGLHVLGFRVEGRVAPRGEDKPCRADIADQFADIVVHVFGRTGSEKGSRNVPYQAHPVAHQFLELPYVRHAVRVEYDLLRRQFREPAKVSGPILIEMKDGNDPCVNKGIREFHEAGADEAWKAWESAKYPVDPKK
jgi:hypothetical protein